MIISNGLVILLNVCLCNYSDGIMAPSGITTVKFDDIVKTLNTGDLVLFSGATTSGALIKLFDNAEFSHIGIVCILP